LRAFVVGTGVRLLSWLFVALILAVLARWEGMRGKGAQGGTEVTGTERPANLTHLTGCGKSEDFALLAGVRERIGSARKVFFSLH
jgi:hypothetical protein